MKDKNFLNALDDWGTILTNTYEDAADKSCTMNLKWSVKQPVYKFYKEENNINYIKRTDEVGGRSNSLKFINIEDPEVFEIRAVGGKGYKKGGIIDCTIRTPMKNILIDDKPLIDLIFNDPAIDKTKGVCLIYDTGYAFDGTFDDSEDSLMNKELIILFSSPDNRIIDLYGDLMNMDDFTVDINDPGVQQLLKKII